MSLFTDRDGDALVVIGMQEDILAGVWHRDEVVDVVAGLVRRARLGGTPVVWVQHHDDDLESGSPGWQIAGELIRDQGEPLVDAEFVDAFSGTGLHDVLASVGASHLFLAGARSDTGVRATLAGGLYRGYDTTLVSDAHTTVDDSFEGVELAASVVVQVINRLAWTTHLPGVTAGLVASADVVFGQPVTDAELLAASELDDAFDDDRADSD